MNSLTRQCHGCREPIPPADFENHRAFMIMRRDYCGSCADRITRRRTPFDVLALPPLREHPRIAAAVVISLAVLALLVLGLRSF